jgi:hypothetical protein
MRVLNESVIRGPRTDLWSLPQRLEANLTNGWRRDRAVEERLRGVGASGDNAFCFSCPDAPKRPAAALWLQARTPEEWYVSNLVPLGRYDLSDEEYNRILGEFETTFLQPLSRGSAVHPEIVPIQTRLEDYVSPETCRRLRAFSAAANRTHLHPNDRWRWHAFLIHAHRADAALDPQTLEEWLEAEGWPAEQRGKLASEYEAGRALLTHYDEEQNRCCLRLPPRQPHCWPSRGPSSAWIPANCLGIVDFSRWISII